MPDEIRNRKNTSLDATRIVNTVEKLCRRIEERFPDSGLHGVSLDLLETATRTERNARIIDRPIHLLRVLSFALVLLIVVSILFVAWLLIKEYASGKLTRASDLLNVIEAGSNEVVMASVLAFFLISLERRIKRKKALAAINELRAIAHVIDMHQLTKDPATKTTIYVPTESSPRRDLDQAGLIRYLDYCAELLAITGKLAAIYIQRFDDAVTLTAANDIEILTTQLARKIWQKIMIAYSKPLG